MKLFSTEQVSKYHPDKYADQISDAILDACLAEDKDSRVACECMVKGEAVATTTRHLKSESENWMKSILQRLAKCLKTVTMTPNWRNF